MRRRTADRATLALATLGLLIAGYLTALHYDSSIPLACSAGAFVNCETVLASPSAMVLGVPVAVWGLGYFAVAIALAALLVRRGERARSANVRTLSLAWSATGTAGVMYLVYQEVGVIGKLCAWCTAVHAIIITMLIVQTLVYSENTNSPTAANASQEISHRA